MIRVLVVDDHPVWRTGLKAALEDSCDIRVRAEAGDEQSALTAVREQELDLVLLDINLPEPIGLRVLEGLLALRPELAVLILSQYEDRAFLEPVLASGGRGFLNKSAEPATIREAAREAVAGRLYLTAAQREARPASPLVRRPTANPLARLSTRELEVLAHMAAYKSTSEIAGILGVTPQAVSTYKARMVQKLGLSSAAELARYFELVRPR